MDKLYLLCISINTKGKKNHRREGRKREQGPRAELSPAPTLLTQEAVSTTCFQVTSAVPPQEWKGAQTSNEETGLYYLLVNAGISFFIQPWMMLSMGSGSTDTEALDSSQVPGVGIPLEI